MKAPRLLIPVLKDWAVQTTLSFQRRAFCLYVIISDDGDRILTRVRQTTLSLPVWHEPGACMPSCRRGLMEADTGSHFSPLSQAPRSAGLRARFSAQLPQRHPAPKGTW